VRAVVVVCSDCASAVNIGFTLCQAIFLGRVKEISSSGPVNNSTVISTSAVAQEIKRIAIWTSCFLRVNCCLGRSLDSGGR